MINFPDAPTLDQTFSAVGLSWRWDNTKWVLLSGSPQTITLSGDVSGSGTSAIPTTLGTVNSNTGAFQGITVNGKGLVTGAVNQNYISGTATIAQGGTGATTAAGAATNLAVLPLSGGTISGSLTVSAAIGAVNISVTGATSSFSVEDQTAPGTNWLQYASSGSMRLWRAGDQLTISNAGNLTILGGTATKVGGGSWAAPSDTRLKREITEYKSGLNQVLALKPIEYKYNGKGGMPDDGRSYVGLDAGSTQLVMPELVGSMMVTLDPQPQGDLPAPKPPDTEIKTIDPSALMYALVNSCKELAARVAALEQMLSADGR